MLRRCLFLISVDYSIFWLGLDGCCSERNIIHRAWIGEVGASDPSKHPPCEMRITILWHYINEPGGYGGKNKLIFRLPNIPGAYVLEIECYPSWEGDIGKALLAADGFH